MHHYIIELFLPNLHVILINIREVLTLSNKISIKRQKVLLTPLLQDTIKNLRKKYNKRVDNLSKQLQKGASYIS